MRYLTTFLTTFVLTLSATRASAQNPTVSAESLRPSRVVWSDRAANHGVTWQKPDSVKNGAIIGAVVGGAAMAAFMTFLIHGVGCVAEDTPCGREVAIASLMTAGAAGAGALIGAGIDKAVHDQRHTTLPANRVVPVLSPKRAGVFVSFNW